MVSLLLAIIYLAFISLGLPDSLLGSAWPVMQTELSVPVSYVGIVTMIISVFTIISSLLSDRLTHKLGTGVVTAGSVLLTAAALFGFSASHSFFALCLWAIPYGFGAGGVDAALNNYVALHYSSRHMSWLHCFWGVGTLISPYIMSGCLTGGLGWNAGYRVVSILQMVLTVALVVSLPIWKKLQYSEHGSEEKTKAERVGLVRCFKIRGVLLLLIAFFGYCALESTTMLWASSYLVQCRGVPPETAAAFASLFFIGITAGRFLSGFIADRVGDRRLIRCGGAIILLGIGMVALPLKNTIPALAGFVVIGLGCAPVYPSIVHSTPYNFGKQNSQAIIGIQMAFAYLGSTFMPPLFGLLAEHVSTSSLPAYLAFFALFMLFMTEWLNRKLAQKPTQQIAE